MYVHGTYMFIYLEVQTCSIVHTWYIHVSNMYVHVYARWVGFQMITIITIIFRLHNCLCEIHVRLHVLDLLPEIHS